MNQGVGTTNVGMCGCPKCPVQSKVLSAEGSKPLKGGNYAATVEHESHDTFMAMQNSPEHIEAGKRVALLSDGNPTLQFYEVIIE
jgi:hypothetical protein